ncbi:MAG TPA: alanine racemase [Gemmatimonadales bacterium]|jgi:D-serine deaminase-like pyridoxal phosphate-dependent protein
MTTIYELPTPALLLDLDVLERNLEWMAARCRALDVALRPHIKTHKCIEIAQRQIALGGQGITVATLQEARDFADHGFADITWAFPVVLSRLEEIQRLADRITLRVVVDSHTAIDALESLRCPLHVWLKIDCGYHRAGVAPDDPIAEALAARLAASDRLSFDGLLTHSGHAYAGPGRAEALAAAREERDVTVGFAERLRAHGISVSAVSVGSTPAMRAIDSLDGVSEARPGNYAFFDYTQVTLGSCTPAECALTVLATVVSSRPSADHAVVDAGALALSKDTGGKGTVPGTMGETYRDYALGVLHGGQRLIALSQEHGVMRGSLTVGERVRILTNHSCLAAACFDEYWVVQGPDVVDRWPILRHR